MTAYATTSDLANAVPAGLLARGNSTQQQRALDDACAAVDGYLRARFTLPLTDWGEDLKGTVLAIAAYKFGMAVGVSSDGLNENFRLMYEDARRWLEQVAAGKITPEVTQSPEGTAKDPDSGNRSGESGVSEDRKSFVGNTNPTPRGW